MAGLFCWGFLVKSHCKCLFKTITRSLLDPPTPPPLPSQQIDPLSSISWKYFEIEQSGDTLVRNRSDYPPVAAEPPTPLTVIKALFPQKDFFTHTLLHRAPNLQKHLVQIQCIGQAVCHCHCWGLENSLFSPSSQKFMQSTLNVSNNTHGPDVLVWVCTPDNQPTSPFVSVYCGILYNWGPIYGSARLYVWHGCEI